MANVVFISDDLMFGSKVAAAASASPLDVTTCMSQSVALTRLAEGDVRYVIVDLNGPADLDQLAEAISGMPEPKPVSVAFGPHVQVDRLAAARAAGFDRVITQSQLGDELQRIFAFSA